MKHFVLCLACLALYPFVRRGERRQAAQDVPEKDLDYFQHIPRVLAWVFPTGHGNEIGWRVKAHDVEEAAEILSQSPCMGARAS